MTKQIKSKEDRHHDFMCIALQEMMRLRGFMYKNEPGLEIKAEELSKACSDIADCCIRKQEWY